MRITVHSNLLDLRRSVSEGVRLQRPIRRKFTTLSFRVSEFSSLTGESFALSGAWPFNIWLTHDLRRGLYSIAALRLGFHSFEVAALTLACEGLQESRVLGYGSTLPYWPERARGRARHTAQAPRTPDGRRDDY